MAGFFAFVVFTGFIVLCVKVPIVGAISSALIIAFSLKLAPKMSEEKLTKAQERMNAFWIASFGGLILVLSVGQLLHASRSTRTADDGLPPPDPRAGAVSACEDAFQPGLPDNGVWMPDWTNDAVRQADGSYDVSVAEELKVSGSCPIRMMGACNVVGDRVTITSPYHDAGYTPC